MSQNVGKQTFIKGVEWGNNKRDNDTTYAVELRQEYFHLPIVVLPSGKTLSTFSAIFRLRANHAKSPAKVRWKSSCLSEKQANCVSRVMNMKKHGKVNQANNKTYS